MLATGRHCQCQRGGGVGHASFIDRGAGLDGGRLGGGSSQKAGVTGHGFVRPPRRA